MTQPPHDLVELRTLLDALCEESITDEQFRRLEELLLGRPEAEAHYVQYMSLYADLVRHAAAPHPGSSAGPGPAPGAPPQAAPAPAAAPAGSPRAGGGRRLLLLGGVLGLAGLAAAVLVALLPGRVSVPDGGAVVPPPEQLDDSVAVLLQASGAVWEDNEAPGLPGTPLPPGRLRLRSGLAQLEFYSGATVILEGPADLQLVSPREAYCRRGKLRVTVPPQARGFTVGSPKLDLVDQGTEFGLRVSPAGPTEVHVFAGKVEVYDAGRAPGDAPQGPPPWALTTGRGLRLEEGRPRDIDSDPAAFLTAQDLAARRDAELRQRQRDWLAASAALRQDPALVVYYPFEPEQPWSRTLRDEAGGRRQPHDGAVVGCAWVPGRWPGKHALEFKRVSDRVRFRVPGAFDALTLAAWVRVDALPNRFNSLLMTEGWEEAAPHWHISTSGKLELGVQGKGGKGGVHYYSTPVLTEERLGHWAHLAVAYDRDAGQVTHYVDGKPVAREPLKLDLALRLGNVEMGNWDVGARQHNHPIRYFNGRIDEFLLFSRALTDNEIGRLYAQGLPPD
jgi:hypothetical protein